MAFKNNPRTDGKYVKHVHQPISIDHYGIHFKILENGRVIITVPVKDAEEFDEVEVPASLIFKIAMFLQATRKTEITDKV
jgi:hypothetical protein